MEERYLGEENISESPPCARAQRSRKHGFHRTALPNMPPRRERSDLEIVASTQQEITSSQAEMEERSLGQSVDYAHETVLITGIYGGSGDIRVLRVRSLSS